MPVRIVRKTHTILSDLPSTNNSPGSYAVSSVETRPWSTTTVTVSRPKTRRAKPDPIIVNPIFKECADLVVDPTWKTIFSESSLGKLPRGFTYKDGYITHKIRNKISRVELSQDPVEVMHQCMDFFKEKAGIMSQEDQRQAKEDFEDYLLRTGALCPQKWTQIKKKKIKDVLISTFLSRLSIELKLSREEKIDLRNKIYLGFILGCFGNDQVELENGYIRSIAGLDFNSSTRSFTINYLHAPKQVKKSRRVDKATKPKNSFYTLWIKYLESLEKRILRSSQHLNSIPDHHPIQSVDETPDSAESGFPVHEESNGDPFEEWSDDQTVSSHIGVQTLRETCYKRSSLD